MALNVQGGTYATPLDTLAADILSVYGDHLADTAVHTIADVVNVLAVTVLDAVQYHNIFGGEYAKLIGLPEYNTAQVERNEPWSDKVELIASLWTATNILNAFKTAFNAHLADVAVHGAADTVNVIAGAAVSIPTPNGIVPSLNYESGFSKFLVELDRSEPAFLKAKLGLWIKDILVLAQEAIVKYTDHITASAPTHMLGAAPPVLAPPGAPATPTGLTLTPNAGPVYGSKFYAGATNFYAVTSLNAIGEESLACAAVSAVQGVDGSMDVVWDSMAGATSYRIYRDPVALNVALMVEVPAGSGLTQTFVDINNRAADAPFSTAPIVRL